MADRGIKFAKDGKTISSTNPDDYNFWTKYPPLKYLRKQTLTISSNDSDLVGTTTTIPHGYDFTPLTMVYVKKAGSDRYFMPVYSFIDLGCDMYSATDQLYFNVETNQTNVVINWASYCEDWDWNRFHCPEVTFIVEIYYYAWKLGTSFNP